MNESDAEVLCVVLDSQSAETVSSFIKGDLKDVGEIQSRNLCKEEEIKKVYKIKAEELKVGSLLDAVINRISTKEVVPSF